MFTLGDQALLLPDVFLPVEKQKAGEGKTKQNLSSSLFS